MTEITGDKIINSIPAGFLKKYRTGNDESAVYIDLNSGFLRLEYTENGDHFILSRVSFVMSKSLYSSAIGNVLECGLSPDSDCDDVVTFIGEMGVSGLQWARGEEHWGHTYDDEQDRSAGRKIDLGTWFDECIAKMINPSSKTLASIKKGYNLKKDLADIKSGRSDARERLWQKCSPATDEDAEAVLGLLGEGITGDDGDLIFTCCDPLKRASAGIGGILDTVTSWLEKGLPESDYDRSEMQEILAAHSAEAGNEVAERWALLCGKALDDKGADSLHAINEGSLFLALASVKDPGAKVMDMLNQTVSVVESSPAAVRDGVEGLNSYRLIKKKLSSR